MFRSFVKVLLYRMLLFAICRYRDTEALSSRRSNYLQAYTRAFENSRSRSRSCPRSTDIDRILQHSLIVSYRFYNIELNIIIIIEYYHRLLFKSNRKEKHCLISCELPPSRAACKDGRCVRAGHARQVRGQSPLATGRPLVSRAWRPSPDGRATHQPPP